MLKRILSRTDAFFVIVIVIALVLASMIYALILGAMPYSAGKELGCLGVFVMSLLIGVVVSSGASSPSAGLISTLCVTLAVNGSLSVRSF